MRPGILLILFLVVVVAACDDSPSSPEDGDSTAPPPPSVAFTAATAPRVWGEGRTTLFEAPFDPGAVYLLTSEGELFRRADLVSTWALVGRLPVSVSAHTWRALASPSVAGRIYVNTAEGLWRTDDGGRHWIDCDTDLVARTLLDDTPERVIASVGTTLHASTDGGRHWEGLGDVVTAENARVVDVVAHPENAAILLASVYSPSWDLRGVYRSEDAGANWQRTTRDDANSLAVSPASPQRVYYGNNFTSQSFFTSDDFGLSWDDFSDRDSGMSGHITPHPTDPNVAVFGDAVLTVTTDAGQSSQPTWYSRIDDILLTSGGTHAIVVQGQVGVVRVALSGAMGADVLSSGLPDTTVRAHTDHPPVVSQSGTVWYLGGSSALLERHDADGRWRRRVLPMWSVSTLAVDHGTERLYAAGFLGPSSVDPYVLLTSDDRGVSWSRRADPPRLTVLVVKPGRDGLVGLQQSGEISVADLEGQNWTPVALDTDPVVRCIATHPRVSFMACLADSGYHTPEPGLAAWSYTSTDTLEVDDLLLAPWLDPPVLLHAEGRLHARAPDGAWHPLEDLPELVSIASWCLTGEAEPALLLSGLAEDRWWLWRLDAMGIHRLATDGRCRSLQTTETRLIATDYDRYLVEAAVPEL